MRLFLIILIGLSSIFVSGQTPLQKYTIDVTVDNLASKTGVLMMNLVDKKGEPVQQIKVPVNNIKCKLTIKNVEAGEYAIMYFHDANSNDTMDSYFMGIPKEGYGFSNNPFSRFGAPPLEAMLFKVEFNTSLELITVNW